MLTVLILGLIGFAVVAIWLNQKSGPRNSRGDASAGFYGGATSAGHVHSDHCGHGHDRAVTVVTAAAMAAEEMEAAAAINMLHYFYTS